MRKRSLAQISVMWSWPKEDRRLCQRGRRRRVCCGCCARRPRCWALNLGLGGRPWRGPRETPPGTGHDAEEDLARAMTVATQSSRRRPCWVRGWCTRCRGSRRTLARLYDGHSFGRFQKTLVQTHDVVPGAAGIRPRNAGPGERQTPSCCGNGTRPERGCCELRGSDFQHCPKLIELRTTSH